LSNGNIFRAVNSIGINECKDLGKLADYSVQVICSGFNGHRQLESITLSLKARRTEMPTRRERIEAMLAEEPGDTFLRYSLALELEKEARHDESLQTLQQLTRDATPYVPAFFMAAQQLAKLNRVNDARTFLREGIDEARRQGNAHAAGEMSEFLMSLGSHGE
jgi:predicted Zn-dependent protease